MLTVPQNPRPRNPVAFYASLDALPGIAMRTTAGQVCFLTEATGLWTELHDADAPRLVLYGKMDLADSQMAADGHRVRVCSRTLVGV